MYYSILTCYKIYTLGIEVAAIVTGGGVWDIAAASWNAYYLSQFKSMYKWKFIYVITNLKWLINKMLWIQINTPVSVAHGQTPCPSTQLSAWHP